MKVPTLTPEYLRELGAGMRQQIIATLTPEDLKKLDPITRQKIIANLSPAERLAGLDPTVIEAYLRQQQAQSKAVRSSKAKPAGRKLKKAKTH